MGTAKLPEKYLVDPPRNQVSSQFFAGAENCAALKSQVVLLALPSLENTSPHDLEKWRKGGIL